MNVPTIRIPSHEPPEQVMQQSPVRPQLAVLEWANSSDASALIPSHLYNKWKDHESFAEEFGNMKDNLAQHGIYVSQLRRQRKHVLMLQSSYH